MRGSTTIIIILFGIFCVSCGGENQKLDPLQNQIIRETVNNAAGRIIIPEDTVFELKSFIGTSTSSSVHFPNGGSAILSEAAYASNGSAHFCESAITFGLIMLCMLIVRCSLD